PASQAAPTPKRQASSQASSPSREKASRFHDVPRTVSSNPRVKTYGRLSSLPKSPQVASWPRLRQTGQSTVPPRRVTQWLNNRDSGEACLAWLNCLFQLLIRGFGLSVRRTLKLRYIRNFNMRNPFNAKTPNRKVFFACIGFTLSLLLTAGLLE